MTTAVTLHRESGPVTARKTVEELERALAWTQLALSEAEAEIRRLKLAYVALKCGLRFQAPDVVTGER